MDAYTMYALSGLCLVVALSGATVLIYGLVSR
jgi:hypothetical protein